MKSTAGISEVFLHPLLRTLEINSTSLALALDNAYNLTKLTTLYLFFDINRHASLVPKLHAFVGSLTNLTNIKVSNCCTDALMAVIGENCKKLQVCLAFL